MKKKSTQFDKFTKKKSNAAIKEEFRQEKRKWKKEREEFFDKKREAIKNPALAGRGVVKKEDPNAEQMPLNKYIAHAGICGRREAAELVKKELVKVNGVLVTEPGHKISPQDIVVVNGKKI